MASIPSSPTYFLAPNCDYPPDGLIALGSIIVHPKSPQKSLNSRNHQRIAVPAADVQESFKDNWEDHVKSTRQNKLTIWTNFIQMVFRLGSDVSAGQVMGREDLYKFRRLETKHFEPDPAYIEDSLRAEGVMAYLSATRFKTPVYMVTGIKIARGASVTSKTVKENKGTLQVGASAAVPVGAPVSAGPNIELSSTREREATFDGGSDYVFAYRVLKISLGRGGALKEVEEFNKGALFTTEGIRSSGKDLISGNWSAEELAITSEELHGGTVMDGNTVTHGNNVTHGNIVTHGNTVMHGNTVIVEDCEGEGR